MLAKVWGGGEVRLRVTQLTRQAYLISGIFWDEFLFGNRLHTHTRMNIHITCSSSTSMSTFLTTSFLACHKFLNFYRYVYVMVIFGIKDLMHEFYLNNSKALTETWHTHTGVRTIERQSNNTVADDGKQQARKSHFILYCIEYWHCHFVSQQRIINEAQQIHHIFDQNFQMVPLIWYQHRT